MRVAIRVDASLEIGTGHVMRCLTLARRLRANGANVMFICREGVGNLCTSIEAANFRCSRLLERPEPIDGMSAEEYCATDARQTRAVIDSCGQPPNLLIVDHYLLDESWESAMRPAVGRIFVIDDLANRAHDCDLLLDQNLHDSPDSRYSRLVPKGARIFAGPRYALLRPEFDSTPAAARANGLRRMLVFFGGVDATNEALKIVLALRSMGASAPDTDVVLGPANRNVESIRTAAGDMACVNIVAQTDDMARLMREADLGIGTCGVAAWERCRVGLASLVVVSADNQRDDARILHVLGAARNLGDAPTVGIDRWAREIEHIRRDPALLNAMSIAAAAVMAGRSEAVRELEAALVA